MTSSTSRFSACALCSLAAACSQAAATPPADLPGYTHTLAHSRFDLGSLVGEIDESGMHKVIGTDGTFATELASGAVVATHDDVPFPDPRTGVYPGDADAQNAAVRSYFVTAGLPEDQIASISADGTGLVQGENVLSGWYSLLHRGWQGVPIVDSMADAAFDAEGRSAFEQVYWPPIPGAVLAQASALQKMLADPVQSAAYLMKLPASSRDGIAVIRHTSWYWQGPFQAQACCRGSTPASPCFDREGQLVQLPGDDGRAADGGAIDGPDGNEAGGTDAGGEAQVVCPISESGTFVDLPSGTCSGVGSCAIELDNTCRPGLAFVPSVPSVFDCQCASGQWQCHVVSGGLGLRPCGDAGP